MSKLKKRLKKAALAGVALYGASKLMGAEDAGINIDKGRGSALGDKYRSLKNMPVAKSKNSAIKILQDESLTNLNPRTKTGNINRLKLMATKGEIDSPAKNIIKRKSNRIGFTRRSMGGEAAVKTRLNGTLKTKTY
tara:strand:+ start:805 stop:1212 length:408 start_codon:yes stop_codon:yes gene_type:complete